MTKAELVIQLAQVPDNALVIFFNGNEELEVARDVIMHDPKDPNYYAPCEGHIRSKPLWIVIGRNYK